MRVDIKSLGTFNQLAHEGAEQATRSMSQMTGIGAKVDVTKITLVGREDIGEQLIGDDYVGVRFDFEGELTGETVLVFDRAGSETIIESLVPGGAADEAMAQSSVEEIGNIMMSGFIDGWADYLEATIEHSPPEYVEGNATDMVPSVEDGSDRDQVFLFKSEIEWVGESVSFYIYMLPEYGSMTDLMTRHADTESDAIPIDKLEVFNEMTKDGTQRAADNVEMMTGIETEAEVSRISFAPIEDVPKQIGSDTYVGTVVEFTGVPSGFLLVLFDEESAVHVAEGMMPVEMESSGLTDQHKAAIEELGNIMTSGFVDGWANVLQTSVDHTPPRLVHDMGQSIMDPLAAQVGQHQEHAFIIDSKMRTDDIEFGAEIHALPNEKELREALDELLVERADQTEADVEQIF
jgi:two-component system chemotaxis sensor kinase CheA/chemotaxis protein CheC